MSSVAGIEGAIAETRADAPVAERRDVNPGKPMFQRFSKSPLLPEAGSGGAPLTAVIAVISSLATLALAAFILIASAAQDWTSDLRTTATIQVKGADIAEIETRAAAAQAVLGATPDVVSYTVINSSEAGKLLEPWLGKGNTEGLNVPALIELRLVDGGRDRLDQLSTKLAGAAPGLVLDDHGDWNKRLAAAARSGQALAFVIFGLIMGAACAISIFAARAGLSANAEVVSLLHLVGATDGFIANEVQRRFTVIGLRGSMIGLAVALFFLGLLALATRTRSAEGAFLPGLSIGPDLIWPLLLVPLAICLATAVSARLTVLRTLQETY